MYALPLYSPTEFAKTRTRALRRNQYRNNRQKFKDRSKLYYHSHRQKMLMYAKQHKDKLNQHYREWYARNRKLARSRVHASFCSNREIQRKHRSKRRTLGFVCLNTIFEGSHAHHIDQSHVCYVPKELHSSIHHNLWSGNNMKAINTKVFEWLKETNDKPFLDVPLPLLLNKS